MEETLSQSIKFGISSLFLLLLPDVAHKMDEIDKIPKFMYQLILNFECFIV